MVRGRGTALGVMSAGRADGGVYRETGRGVKGSLTIARLVRGWDAQWSGVIWARLEHPHVPTDRRIPQRSRGDGVPRSIGTSFAFQPTDEPAQPAIPPVTWNLRDVPSAAEPTAAVGNGNAPRTVIASLPYRYPSRSFSARMSAFPVWVQV